MQRGDWPTAKKLCHHLEALGIKPMQHRSIGKVLCKRISTIVRPMAKNLLPNGLRSPSVVDEDVSLFAQSDYHSFPSQNHYGREGIQIRYYTKY